MDEDYYWIMKKFYVERLKGLGLKGFFRVRRVLLICLKSISDNKGKRKRKRRNILWKCISKRCND